MASLLFYRLLVMLELFTAEFLFMLRLRKRKLFALRFFACVVVGEGIAAVLPIIYDQFYTSFTFLLLFGVTLPMLAFCCDENWKNIFFCGIAAYSMQHLAYGVANFVLTLVQWGATPIFGMYFESMIDFSKLDNMTLLLSFIYILAYFVSYTAFYYIFIRRIKRGETFRIKSTKVLTIIGIALVLDILLNTILVYKTDSDNITMTLMNILYESLCCGFLLYIQFGLLRTGELENELDVTQYLLREQERQYNLSKANIELINMKCHDLRHQIRSVGREKDLPKDVVTEIEKTISIYDAAVRTDNEVLDTILTEKSLVCAHDGIALTCVADGKSLEFMAAADVYSLFGNALDNAIEAVNKLPTEKRSIDLIVRRVGEMVSINVTNPYDGTIAMNKDGLPMTDKQDRNFHGIGIKSILMTADRYGGVCSVTTADNIFVLNILLLHRS